MENNILNSNLSKSSITKLSRRAGVKSMSEDCHNIIRNLIGMKLNDIIKNIIIVNNVHSTKTIMPADVYKALELLGYTITESQKLNNCCKKKIK
jgi:histone H3/H4